MAAGQRPGAAAVGLCWPRPRRVPLIGVLLVRRRRHLINIAYLRWCLAEQARHAARQGVTLTRRRSRRRGASGRETFLAGGFVWQLDDGFKNMLVTGQPGPARRPAPSTPCSTGSSPRPGTARCRSPGWSST